MSALSSTKTKEFKDAKVVTGGDSTHEIGGHDPTFNTHVSEGDVIAEMFGNPRSTGGFQALDTPNWFAHKFG